jgi:hypothetical protein
MTDDILAPFRKAPLAPASAAAPPEGKAEYVAFGTKDNVSGLRIRRRDFLTYATGYNFLLVAAYDDDRGTVIMLNFSFMKVKIEGKNLQNLVHAINAKKAEFVMEFDPDRWAEPTDANAPFITSIEVKITSEMSADEMKP